MRSKGILAIALVFMVLLPPQPAEARGLFKRILGRIFHPFRGRGGGGGGGCNGGSCNPGGMGGAPGQGQGGMVGPDGLEGEEPMGPNGQMQPQGQPGLGVNTGLGNYPRGPAGVPGGQPMPGGQPPQGMCVDGNCGTQGPAGPVGMNGSVRPPNGAPGIPMRRPGQPFRPGQPIPNGRPGQPPGNPAGQWPAEGTMPQGEEQFRTGTPVARRPGSPVARRAAINPVSRGRGLPNNGAETGYGPLPTDSGTVNPKPTNPGATAETANPLPESAKIAENLYFVKEANGYQLYEWAPNDPNPLTRVRHLQIIPNGATAGQLRGYFDPMTLIRMNDYFRPKKSEIPAGSNLRKFLDSPSNLPTYIDSKAYPHLAWCGNNLFEWTGTEYHSVGYGGPGVIAGVSTKEADSEARAYYTGRLKQGKLSPATKEIAISILYPNLMILKTGTFRGMLAERGLDGKPIVNSTGRPSLLVDDKTGRVSGMSRPETLGQFLDYLTENRSFPTQAKPYIDLILGANKPEKLEGYEYLRTLGKGGEIVEVGPDNVMRQIRMLPAAIPGSSKPGLQFSGQKHDQTVQEMRRVFDNALIDGKSYAGNDAGRLQAQAIKDYYDSVKGPLSATSPVSASMGGGVVPPPPLPSPNATPVEPDHVAPGTPSPTTPPKTSRPQVEIARQRRPAPEFEGVGRIILKHASGPDSYCSGMVLTHGLFVFAKHCLRTPGTTVRSIEFYKADGKSISVPVNEKIELGGNGNDVAFANYDPTETDGTKGFNVEPNADSLADSFYLKKNKGEVPKNLKVMMVGFPKGHDGNDKTRMVSEGCVLTRHKAVLGPKGSDPGYDGVLYDTTCQGWFGLSGGAVIGIDEAGTKHFLGVVTHSFDFEDDGVTLKGRPENNRDSFGKLAQTTNFSPMWQVDQGLLQRLFSEAKATAAAKKAALK